MGAGYCLDAIYQASGRAVIGMCCDFQDPPGMIGAMVRQWRSGAQIVLGQRRSEKTGPLLGLLRRAGYAFFRRFGDYPLIPGATGFGLYSREVVDELSTWNEPEPFFRGMVVLGQSLKIGVRALLVASNHATEEEEQLSSRQVGVSLTIRDSDVLTNFNGLDSVDAAALTAPT